MNGPRRPRRPSLYQPYASIPRESLASRPRAHPRHGTPSVTWEYRDADGETLAYVLRFDPLGERKQFAPLTWTPGTGWQWKAPPEPRPLYGLDRLAARPEAPALFCEGEKAVDAAAELIPEAVSTTTMNGAQAPEKSDFGPLAGRRVLIWPDHDEPGASYATKVAGLAWAAGARSVEVLDLGSLARDPVTGEPRDLPAGWDADDAIADGWYPQALAERARWTAAEPRAPGAGGETPRETPDTTEVTLIEAAGIRPEPVAWLWDGWLARGKVHILAGAPGTGKTTAAVAMAATVTVGGTWPDGTRAEAGDVVIWSGEDDPRDTLIPRLIAAGADLSRVRFVAGAVDKKGPRAWDPSSDLPALADALADNPPALLIVDPVVSAVLGDSHKNAEVRRALQPLVDLAQVRRCAVLGVSHFSKGTAGREPVDRVTGSLAFGAVSRVVLATAKLPDEEGGGRILVRAKNNLGPDSGGFRYDLDPLELPDHPGVHTTRVLWGEVLDGTARELLSRAESQANPEQRSATSEAVDWLREHLENGPAKANDVQREAREAGISEKALRTARERLGVKTTKSEFSGGWRWALPPQDAQSAAKMPKMPEQENKGALGTFAGERASSDGDDWGEDIV